MSTRPLLCISEKPLLPALALPGWDITTVADCAKAAHAIARHPYRVAMIVDHGRDQFAQFSRLAAAHADLQWIGLLRGDSLTLPACRNLVIDYLHDYHTLPVDSVRLAHTLGHAFGWSQLRAQRRPANAVNSGLHRITGKSAAIVALRMQIDKIARINAPVLICGESGSGKELTASALHALSGRAAGPFVAINCGAMPSALIQAELFGYEQGAFTGALKAKAGLIESAQGGTIFFDEIADLPLEQQANLLRFLQEGTIYRIGATKCIRIDARVIAASHVNLQTAAAAARFREDLYYRLQVLPINVPPLRERQEDLADLAQHFFNAYAADKNPVLRGFSSSALDAIAQHNWPGNVRELINRVRRAMVLGEGRWITPFDLGLDAQLPTIASDGKLDKVRVHAERKAICVKLEEASYNISRAARELGVSRMTLYRLMAKHQIAPLP
ncbi:MAG: sigma-54-dependent Fis family transcriptional regulator [Sandarakinorhabdus sp.]|nr:sigma-54-dependent Fis family transcriptional regulator [Sandarakinorhabdus sp.]